MICYQNDFRQDFIKKNIMNSGNFNEPIDGEEIIRLDDDDSENSIQLILGEEKGFFKPEDTFWIDEFIAKEWQIRSPKNFKLEITTNTGSRYDVKGVSCAKKGGYITATKNTIDRMRLTAGELLSVRPVSL